MLARFRETIPTVQSVFSFEIYRITYGFLTEINNFVIEITILPFFQKLEFLGSYTISGMSRKMMKMDGRDNSECQNVEKNGQNGHLYLIK